MGGKNVQNQAFRPKLASPGSVSQNSSWIPEGFSARTCWRGRLASKNTSNLVMFGWGPPLFGNSQNCSRAPLSKIPEMVPNGSLGPWGPLGPIWGPIWAPLGPPPWGALGPQGVGGGLVPSGLTGGPLVGPLVAADSPRRVQWAQRAQWVQQVQWVQWVQRAQWP